MFHLGRLRASTPKSPTCEFPGKIKKEKQSIRRVTPKPRLSIFQDLCPNRFVCLLFWKEHTSGAGAAGGRADLVLWTPIQKDLSIWGV